MKLFNIFLASTILASGLSATELKRSMKVIPLDQKYLSTEYGGTNHASAVLSDGIGVYSTSFDEYARAISYLNGKYGDDSLKNEESLKEYVLNNGTPEDKELAKKLNLSTVEKSAIGDSCDDNNSSTMDDMYTDDAFTCVGKIIIGSECDDNKNWTKNDIYIDVSFTCKGQNSVIGAPCDDLNSNTVDDKYIDENFTCKGSKETDGVKCLGEPIGSFVVEDGIQYLVVSNATIGSNYAKNICTSNVTNLGNFMSSPISLYSANLRKWDVSNVTTLDYLFSSSANGTRRNFTDPVKHDISKWDTSKVTSMYKTFHQLDDYSIIPAVTNWNTSNVTNMRETFFGCYNCTMELNWDTSKVTNMDSMLRSTMFNRNISNWDVSKVTSMYYMFHGYNRMNQNLSKWCTVSMTASLTREVFGNMGINPVWKTCPPR